MQRRIELPGSTLAAVDYAGRDLVIRLMPGYLYEADDEQAEHSGRHYFQNVDLRISQPGPSPVLSALPAAITNGALTLAGQRTGSRIPLPLIGMGATEFWCETSGAERFSVNGKGAAAIFNGERRYVD